jgi:hypothetical protein
MTPTSSVSRYVNAGASTGMDMKKGKSKVPQQMRATYEKQKEMAGMRAQMDAASKPGEDGLPVFNLFVRTKAKNVRLIYVSLPCEVDLVTGWKDTNLSSGRALSTLVKAKKSPCSFLTLSH